MAKVHTIAGKAYWCKLLGDPQPNLKDEPEWSVDLVPDQAGLDLIKRLGLGNKIKNKGDDRGDFVTFRRPLNKRVATKAGKEKNDHVPVTDASGQPWPIGQSIGNGSDVEIKFSTYDYPARKGIPAGTKMVIYEMKVNHLVPFERKEPADRPEAGEKEKWDGKAEA